MDEYQKKIMAAAGKAQKTADKASHTCLVPGCSAKAIGSHSQQRNGQLKAIAKNGEVYAVEKNLYKALKKQQQRYTVRFTRMPISKASVFPGFCSKHDSEIFSPIERAPLVVGNDSQAALLFLRAHAFEYLQKKRVYIWDKSFVESVGHQLTYDVKRNYEAKMIGISQYLELDAPYYFDTTFKALTSPTYDGLKSAWIEIPKNLLVSVSCCVSPLMHRHIDYMTDNHNDVQPAVSFSVVPNSKSTHVVVTWLNEHSDLSSWFREALNSDKELELLINQCVFGESEDTCISPTIWSKLSAEEKTLVEQAVGYTRELEMPAPIPAVVKL